MKKLLFSIALMLLVPSVAKGQSQVVFSESNVTSAGQAQTFEYKLYQTTPTNAVTTFVLASVICTGATSTVNCSAPTPPTITRTVGMKFELTARDVVNNTPVV